MGPTQAPKLGQPHYATNWKTMVRGKWTKMCDSMENPEMWVGVQDWKKRGNVQCDFSTDTGVAERDAADMLTWHLSRCCCTAESSLAISTAPDTQTAMRPIKPESLGWGSKMLNVPSDYKERPGLRNRKAKGWKWWRAPHRMPPSIQLAHFSLF